MFAIEVEKTFCAAHALRLPAGAGGGTAGIEPLHGHNFRVTARLTCRTLDALETVIDFHIVEGWLREIVRPWENRNLNDVEPFASRVNPSAERIAEVIGRAMEGAAARDCGAEAAARGLRVAEVRLTEAPGCVAVWVAG